MSGPSHNSDSGALDRLLRQASVDHQRTTAPPGFAPRVLTAVQQDVGSNPVSAAAESTPAAGLSRYARIVGVGAAVIIAFIGGYYISNGDAIPPRDSGTRSTVAPNTPISTGEMDTFSPTDLENELGAGRGVPRGAGLAPASRTSHESTRGATAPSTIAGRFPRSSDFRVYIVVNRAAADLDLPPAGRTSLPDYRAPAHAGFVSQILSLSIHDAEKLLSRLDTTFPGAAEPHLAVFTDSIVPVSGVVTPPRFDSSAPGKPGPSDDRVEIVIYTRS